MKRETRYKNFLVAYHIFALASSSLMRLSSVAAENPSLQLWG